MTLIDPNSGVYSLPQSGRLGRAPGATPALPQSPVDVKPQPHKALQSDFVEISRSAKAALSRTAPSADSASRAKAAAQESPATYSRADVTNLLDNWGAAKPGSVHDHNGDGRVDATDLAQLVSKLGQLKPEAVSDEPAPYTQDDVQGLLDAWGTGGGPKQSASERYDFNADGRIDATDLAALIARLGASEG
jgi:hypothetical protein